MGVPKNTLGLLKMASVITDYAKNLDCPPPTHLIHRVLKILKNTLYFYLQNARSAIFFTISHLSTIKRILYFYQSTKIYEKLQVVIVLLYISNTIKYQACNIVSYCIFLKNLLYYCIYCISWSHC